MKLKTGTPTLCQIRMYLYIIVVEANIQKIFNPIRQHKKVRNLTAKEKHVQLQETKVGRDPVNIGDNKLRSQNGKWQYRSEPGGLLGHGKGQPHIHLEN